MEFVPSDVDWQRADTMDVRRLLNAVGPIIIARARALVELSAFDCDLLRECLHPPIRPCADDTEPTIGEALLYRSHLRSISITV